MLPTGSSPRVCASVRKRVHIIGGPGSGKSYLAARLAKQYAIPSYALDDLYWDRAIPRYGKRADKDTRDLQLANIVAQEAWIIEGVYYAWLGPSFAAADVIILLNPSVWLRHWRILRRFMIRKFGTVRTPRESALDLWRLLQWNRKYDREHLPRALDAVAAQGRDAIACKTWAEVQQAMKIPHPDISETNHH